MKEAAQTPTIMAFIGIHAKMSRGDMVRFMAERAVTDAEELKNFADFGYEFCPQASTLAKFVFRTDYDFKKIEKDRQIFWSSGLSDGCQLLG